MYFYEQISGVHLIIIELGNNAEYIHTLPKTSLILDGLNYKGT